MTLMIIQTISGMLEAKGISRIIDSMTLYDFVEFQNTETGEFTKLVNVTVGPDCERALQLGQQLTMTHCYTEKRRNQYFPTNCGMSFVSAVFAKADNRVYSDVVVLASSKAQLKKAASVSSCTVWCLAAFMVAFTFLGGHSWITLFGLAIPLVMHFYVVKPTRANAALTASAKEMEPYIAELHKQVVARKKFVPEIATS